MQYYRPPEEGAFAGDAMPFTRGGVFHLVYLLDRGHHQDLGGLGGHQWAQATSTDLVHWEHHPLAIPITAPWEGSICTGSVFVHDGVYYAFYATRMRDWTQHLSLALSEDGIRFRKQTPNPLKSPGARYHPEHFRDPFIFRDPGGVGFHMLVTSMLADPDVPGRGGCLAHLTSRDLRTWEEHDPFLVTGYRGAPECADLFEWHGWWYLIFSHDLVAHYRMARSPLGPWVRPPRDTFDGPMASVMKTAPFGDRRIGVAWIGTREGDRDDGARQWGGNLVLRELVQRADGTLGTRFVEEAMPATGAQQAVPIARAAGEVRVATKTVEVGAAQGLAVAQIRRVPRNCRITMQVDPTEGRASPAPAYGLCLRTAGGFDAGYVLEFSPYDGTVHLANAGITQVAEIRRPFTLQLVAYEDIIDVEIAGQRCLVNRLPERRGDRLLLYAQDGHVRFDEVKVEPFRPDPA